MATNNISNVLKLKSITHSTNSKIDGTVNFIGQIDVHINFIGSGLSQCYCIVHYAHTQCYGFKLFEKLIKNLRLDVKPNVSNTKIA